MSYDRTVSDREWIRAAQHADAQALESLLQKHQGMIRLLAGRLCREHVSLEELIQAGNLGMICAIRHFDVTQNAALMTYCVPWILGEMRRTIRRIECSAYSLDQRTDSEEQSLYDVLVGEDGVNIQHMDLRFALCKLSREEQVLICLRYFRDKTQKESSVILGKSQAQISKMERRALDALHEMLS